MQKKFLVLFCLVFSSLLHVAIISSCSFYLDAKGSPVVYGWSNVINRKDLFLNNKNITFPSGINFSLDGLRKRYLLPFSLTRQFYSPTPNLLPSVTKAPVDEAEFTIKWDNYLYIWEQSPVFTSENEKEIIAYKAYISSHGKVLFMYPEKLPLNSLGNLRLQDYIRKSTFFLGDRFFWTKIEGVVK